MTTRFLRSPWTWAAAGTALAGAALASAPLWPGCRQRGTRGMLAIAGWVLLLVTSTGLVAVGRSARRGVQGAQLALPLAGLILLSGGASLVAGPSYVSALDHGKQKAAEGNVRTIASAIETYESDLGRYPSAGGPASDLTRTLEPTWVKELPVLDGWRHPIVVRSSATSYTVISYGCCGEPDAVDDAAPNGGTHHYTDDIIFSDGSRVRFPDGEPQD